MSPAPGNEDTVHIEALELFARIGVPDEERATPQRLTVSLTLWPAAGLSHLADELAKTVNYAAVCRTVKDTVANRTDKLIETMAEAIAAELLDAFPLTRVRVELRKFILPDVEFVAVVITRER